MKSLFILLFISINAFAGDQGIKRLIQTQGVKEECTVEEHLVRDVDGNESKYFICPDLSITYKQTQDDNCGPTSAVNILKMYCNADSTPDSFRKYFIKTIGAMGYKWTFPRGTLPADLEYGMNKAWKGFCSNDLTDSLEWKISQSSNIKEYLIKLSKAVNRTESSPFERLVDGKTKSKWPVLALVLNGTSIANLHYVTVVDIETDENLEELLSQEDEAYKLLENKSCKVVLNTWDDQYKMNCYDFALAASLTNIDFASRQTLRPARYILIELKEIGEDPSIAEQVLRAALGPVGALL